MASETVNDLGNCLDNVRLAKVLEQPTSEIVQRLVALSVDGIDRRQRMFDLAEIAIEHLPNDTDSDKSLAVLEALRDRLLKNSNDAFEACHLIAALIQREEANHEQA